MCEKKLDTLYLRISPDKFHYLKFILEGYDNLAIISSHGRHTGVVILRFPHSMARDLFTLITSIAGYINRPNGSRLRKHSRTL
ncbi:MAG: DUF4911 domain-containing protein [Desulforhopalus sp.]